VKLTLTVNGKKHKVDVPPMKRLLDVLREECKLTGTKEGCGEGECGACTVMIDGETACACLVPVVQAKGAKITTVEGPGLGKLQRCFVEQGGAQCGICTPGMIVSAAELLKRCPRPTLDDVRCELAGNLCRCTGYEAIFRSVLRAARK
jgi:aerobic-type carbon monoxide dehydrogenase small subunit (CoxS/CutS family)